MSARALGLLFDFDCLSAHLGRSAHPEFQALVAGFARNDNTADDLDESAKGERASGLVCCSLTLCSYGHADARHGAGA